MSILTREQMLMPEYHTPSPAVIPQEDLFTRLGNWDDPDGWKHFGHSFAESFLPVAIAQKLYGVHYTDDIAKERLRARRAVDQGEVEADEDFDPAKSKYVAALPDEWMRYAYDVESEFEAKLFYEAVTRRQTELKDRMESGGYGVTGMLSGELSNLGALYSFTAIRSMKDVFIGAGLLTADEIALHKLQPERTVGASVANVAGFTAIGMAINGTRRATTALLNRRVPDDSDAAEKVSAQMANDLDQDIKVRSGQVRDAHTPVRDPNEEILKAEDRLLDEDFFPDEAVPAQPAKTPKEPDPEPDVVGPVELGAQGEELVETGVKLEILRDGPVKRVLREGSDFGKTMVSRLVEHPFFQKKNLGKQRTAHGVDREVAVNWTAPMVDAMKETEQIWVRYRQRVSNSNATTVTGQWIRDLRGRQGALSFDEFLNEVGKAKRSAGNDAGFDPAVIEAANLWHNRIYKPLGEAAKKQKMFSQGLRRELWKVREAARNAVSKAAPKEKAAVKAQYKEQIDDLVTRIKQADTQDLDPAFLNRIYRKDLIRADIEGFKNILRNAGRTEEEAAGITNAILRGIPRNADDDIMGSIEEMAVGRARSLMERSLNDIPDNAFGDFLESNIFALGKYYVARVGPDVELTKAFGSIDLHRQIDAIRTQWLQRIDDAPAVDRAKLQKLMDQEIEDIKVIRDRIRGTYGLPDNPDSWTNRGLRLTKMYNAVTMLTGAIAAVPDVGRLVMYDGMYRMFGNSFDVLNGNLSLLKLAKQEAQLAGEALDMYMSMRAAIFADLSDAMSATSQFEKMAATGTQQFFNVSLMNPWNVGVKTMASLITGSRIIDESIKWSSPLRNSAKATIEYGEVVSNRTGTRVAAKYNKAQNKVFVDLDMLREKWAAKAWTKPAVKGVDPLPENQFKTFEEFRDFVIEHELAHADVRPKGQSLGAYENQMNQIALKRMGSRNAPSAEYEQTKLARSGIDVDMAARISVQFEQHGLRQGTVRIAKTHLWTDRQAAEAYTKALGKEINTIIVTPGKGELPNFMGGGFERFQKARKAERLRKIREGEELTLSEQFEDMFMSPQMGQLILQFKTFGAAATQRVLVPGLQQPDMKFILGAGGLVAMGVMLDHIRDQQNNIKRPKTTGERLRSGIERSGVLGYFADINGGIETLSDGRFGIGPLLGDTPHKAAAYRKFGVVAGPTMQTARTWAKVLSGVSDGEIGKRDSYYLRRTLPMNRVAWADGLFDWAQDGMVTKDYGN